MINNDIRESLQLVCSVLLKHSVDYIVVGGVAVSFHGYDRLSMLTSQRPELKVDLDFWYRPTTDNFIKLSNAIVDLGIDRSLLDQIIFDPEKTFLKIPHKSFHTDFLPRVKGLNSYEGAKKNSIRESIDGNDFHILGYEDLLLNKLAVNRQSDVMDIQELQKKKKNLDVD